MNKYDVNLIVDKEGKPMPQYYDEVEGVMKPITRNNFDGSVQVGNFPDIQKVEVTNQKDVQDVNVTNPVNSVEISNFPLTQDVNVINPQKNVTIDNFPSVQNVTDAQVKAELGQIKATQVQILERLNGQLVTEDGAQVVKQSEPIFYRSPQTEIVFNEVVEGNGQYLVLFEGNIPENTQSIGVSFRKNSQTSITTELSFKQGGTVIRYEVSDWTNEFKAIYPVIGDGLRVRIREMASTTQPLIIALTYYYAPQGKGDSSGNIESAITTLGGATV